MQLKQNILGLLCAQHSLVSILLTTSSQYSLASHQQWVLFNVTHVVTAACLPTVAKSIKNYVYALQIFERVCRLFAQAHTISRFAQNLATNKSSRRRVFK